MSKPPLVQYGDLTAEHFARHPVWISAHVADETEPWYDETDEETFRPWLGALPAGPEDGLLLVQATFTLADGTVLPGFVTPQAETTPSTLTRLLGALVGPRRAAKPTTVYDVLQAEVFLPDGRREQFWDGTVPLSADRRVELLAALLRTLGKPVSAVFPARVAAMPGLTRGRTDAVFAEL